MARDYERIPLKGVPQEFDALIRKLVHLHSSDQTEYIAEKAKLTQAAQETIDGIETDAAKRAKAVLVYLEIGMSEKFERRRVQSMDQDLLYRSQYH